MKKRNYILIILTALCMICAKVILSGKTSGVQYVSGDTVCEDQKYEEYNSNAAKVYHYIHGLKSLNQNTIAIVEHSSDYEIHIDNEKKFTVLQLTDIHISGLEENYDKNIQAMQTVYEMVQREKPDFIVVTGDLIFGTHDSESTSDYISLDMALKFMDALGVPWTWTYGNHDHDFLDRLSLEQINVIFADSETLYIPKTDQSIKGRSNGWFRIYQGDTLVSALILLDSHGEIYNSENEFEMYDYIDETQIVWYSNIIEKLCKMAGGNINTFVYFHIPVEEYDQVDTFVSGEKREAVSCSKVENRLMETIEQSGSTKAVFCGHDHLNDFISYKNGVYMVYGKSIDYTAYPFIDTLSEQRGACRLDIYDNDIFDIENVRY